MGPVMAETTIDAPRERVYAMVADLAMRPAFCDHFQEQYRLQRIDSTGVGAAARFFVDAPRFSMWMESVIAELEAPHLIIERGQGSRIDRALHQAERGAGQSSRCSSVVGNWVARSKTIEEDTYTRRSTPSSRAARNTAL